VLLDTASAVASTADSELRASAADLELRRELRSSSIAANNRSPDGSQADSRQLLFNSLPPSKADGGPLEISEDSAAGRSTAGRCVDVATMKVMPLWRRKGYYSASENDRSVEDDRSG